MESIPNDGKPIGELMFRNILMSGYLKNSEITQKAFRGGWNHTRDLSVRHQNGLGFSVDHGYGMTEALGPAIVKPWKPELDSTFGSEKEKIRNRKGLHNLLIEGVDVKDPNTMESIPNDRKPIGELMFRNILMSGVDHGYGMTEALGPAIVKPWIPELDSTFGSEKEKIRNREGLRNLLIEGVDVKDPNTMKSVPNDRKPMMFRNILMSST
ncbi:unnamed protein product [Dovyalis caffra]|uniref:Uncharacterized protein n=1 Tax=Dovyalis caffra TaxID=77055 RepID=A0AAV1SQA7_9ROSI|nr:unnamed protein product [Dovyalis caffra]